MGGQVGEEIVIYGNGQVAELAMTRFQSDSPHHVVGFTVDGAHIRHPVLHGLPVVPFEDVERHFPPERVRMFVAVGPTQCNRIRADRFEQARRRGYRFASYVSSRAFVAAGATPVGLGARDTLRLEAGLPLYGHELGLDPEGREIPVMSCPLATFAVSFSPRKGDYVGREPLRRQQAAYARILARDYSLIDDLPRLTRPVAVTGRGIAREGAPVQAPEGDARFGDGGFLGWVTSGTAVPYWGVEGEGLCSLQTEEHELRSIALAYVDSRPRGDLLSRVTNDIDQRRQFNTAVSALMDGPGVG